MNFKNEDVRYDELEEYIENELHEEEDLEYFSLQVEENWNG